MTLSSIPFAPRLTLPRLGIALLGSALASLLLLPASAHAADDRYELKFLGTQIAPGKTQQVKIQLTADSPWHMNTDFPTRLQVSSGPGLKIAKTKLSKKDAQTLSEHKIVFALDVTPQSAGNHEIPAKLKFAICKADSCSPASAKFKIKVQSAAPLPTQRPEAKSKSRPASKKRLRPAAKKRKARSHVRRKLASPPAGATPLASAPPALRYLDQWMLSPICGSGLGAQLHLLFQGE